MPELPGSTRSVLKATYVPLIVPDDTSVTVGHAVQKFGFVRQLNLQTGDVAAAGRVMTAGGKPATPALLQTLTQFEGTPLPSRLPAPSVFASVAPADLLAFGKALSSVRQTHVTQLAQAAPAAGAAAATLDPRTLATQLLNTSIVATNGFEQTTSATPIGMLNLERLEMTPAGIQRGELLATIPLAPMEQTAVVQKEWSVTSQEFTSIVTDSLENYSETGVTENTELAQSTTNQNQHSNQFNVNATVVGNIGFVTTTLASQFQTQDQTSNTATASTKHALTTTKKASSRVKQSHKVTISTTTVTGSSESTTRTLQNPSSTDPMRIDYFSLMRKWHVGLYRYGLRMTYDIVIPQPAGALREAYEQLASMQSQLSQGFSFNTPYSAITPSTYQQLAAQFGAQVPPPPAAMPPKTYASQPTTGKGWYFTDIGINVDPGYWITDVSVTLNLGQIDAGTHVGYEVIGSGWSATGQNAGEYSQDLTQFSGFMLHYGGAQTVSIFLDDVNGGTAHVLLTVTTEPTPDAWAQWQANVWNALYSAAQTSFYANQQALQAQVQALQDRLNNVDTLTLRREENDEITKGVLRWLLGPGFEFMPDNVAQLFNGPDASWGIGYSPTSPNTLGLSASDWSTVSTYEQMVRFVNDAIDWDNILYFLYSYFWDVPIAWDNVRNIQHPDSTRQAFLRAGSARVVLTVRKGWEQAWVQFVEGGTFGTGALPQLHPYLAIAQEIQDYDDTNYPGIPPANPGGAAGPDDDGYVATSCSDTVSASSSPVTLTVDSSAGFIVGYKAIIDSYGSGVQELQVITAVPDATHITVKGMTNAHDGSTDAFAVIQAGEKGQLIAEWFEYTPSSGVDIGVTSDLTTIA